MMIPPVQPPIKLSREEWENARKRNLKGWRFELRKESEKQENRVLEDA